MASQIRLMTMDDVKHIIHIKGSKLDILAATVQRATEIYQETPPLPANKTTRQLKRKGAAGPTEPSKKRNTTPSLPPPPLPEEFERAIQDLDGTPARLVIQKFLFATDVAANNNRFSIPVSQVAEEFLTEEEKRHVGCKKYLEVKMIAPSLAVEVVKFTRWDMVKGKGRKTSSCYVINGVWNRIVEENGLAEGMVF